MAARKKTEKAEDKDLTRDELAEDAPVSQAEADVLADPAVDNEPVDNSAPVVAEEHAEARHEEGRLADTERMYPATGPMGDVQGERDEEAEHRIYELHHEVSDHDRETFQPGNLEVGLEDRVQGRWDEAAEKMPKFDRKNKEE